jgi:protoporphyrin/coproporphyrin ferrochelatase
MKHDGILLIGFGGPNSSEEIRPFLANVLRGRPVPPGRIEEVVHHYELMGGRSPYNELTFRQADGLKRILKREGPSLPVYVGMKNWHPLFCETLELMIRDGVRQVLGIILAPHQGEGSWGRYQLAISDTQADIKSRLGMEAPVIEYCKPWHTHPLFIEAAADKLRCKMDKIRFAQKDRIKFFFTAHSVPVVLAHPYVDQILETCQAVAEEAGVPQWELVYQSRSGNPRDPWLEPDVCDVIRQASEAGCRNVVLDPIGFVCDHVEVLYDLDLEARQVAEGLGLGFYRICTVNDHPSFVRMLADVVRLHTDSHRKT